MRLIDLFVKVNDYAQLNVCTNLINKSSEISLV